MVRPTEPTGKRKDPLRLAIRVGVFVVLFYGIGWYVADPLLRALLLNLAGPSFATLISALFATWLALRIYEDIPVFAVGLWWNGLSARNLGLGLIGGIGAACVALVPPLLTGAAYIRGRAPEPGDVLFVLLCLAASATGEELFFRGYGFQILMADLGPWAAILPVGVFFGLMHRLNPEATNLGSINTAGFGILFGYAYFRSRDLWLPIGLHFGWNFTLPLFGAKLSGYTILVSHEMTWPQPAGALWSGGSYGPEASILTSAALVPLFVYVWKAPVRRQSSPLTDAPGKSAICEPSPPLRH